MITFSNSFFKIDFISQGSCNIEGVWKIRSNLFSYIFLQVFVVDSSSSDDDVDLAAAELKEALSHPSLECLPLLVFASKQDVSGARNADEVRTG